MLIQAPVFIDNKRKPDNIDVQDRVSKGYIVYNGSMERMIGEFELLNYRHLHRIWQEA